MLHPDSTHPRFQKSPEKGIPANDNLAAPKSRVVTVASLLGAASVTALIGGQLVILAGALIWAISGLLDIAPLAFYPLAVLLGVAALWACFVVARLAYDAETAFDNNHDTQGVFGSEE